MGKEYVKRFFICALGLACFAVGNVFGVHAGSAGTNAWNTLVLGISGATSLSFGTASLMISALVILIDIIFKGRIGFGTIMNAVLIAWFSDLYLAIFSFLPTAQNQFIGAVLTVIGQTIISFSTILYMSPGLGCGPRDTLMVIIGKHFPKAPIGLVKFRHGDRRFADRRTARSPLRTGHRPHYGPAGFYLSICFPRLALRSADP